MRIKAEILSKNYYDEEKMFGIYTVRDMDSGIIRDLVGTIPPLIPGEIVEGEVTEGTRYNKYSNSVEKQWKTKSTMLPSMPVTPDAIRIFLQSGFAYKVGPSIAERIVKKHGRNTISILEGVEKDIDRHLRKIGKDSLNETEDDKVYARIEELGKDKRAKRLLSPLTDVRGIGIKMAANLMAGWISNKSKHQLLLFLFNCGLSSSMSGKVIKALGAQAADILRENPYKLLHIIPSIPFSVPDKIAREHGMEPADSRRVAAMLLHVINSVIFQSGHVCVPHESLVKMTAGYSEKTGWPIIKDEIEASCKNMVEANILTAQTYMEKEYIYTPETIQAERRIARSLAVLLGEKPHRELPLKFILEHMTRWEKKTGIKLDESQKTALVSSLSSSVSIITGGPGTGKTTIMKCAKHILEKAGLSIAECAPTGKAARNMSPKAQTIHRLLGLNMDNQLRGNPVENDFLFIDETSMMDIFLGGVTMQAITNGSARVVFIGDIDQLPSVGPGMVLRSMVESGKIPVERLNTVHRMKKGGILEFLHVIRNSSPHDVHVLENVGLPSEPELGSEMCFLDSTGLAGNAVMKKTLDAVKKLLSSGYSVRDIQVLTPMKKGDSGVFALNRELQKLLNRSLENAYQCYETISFGNKVTWAPGDRVMNTENDYDNDVFNGEIGFIISAGTETKSVEVVYPELGNRKVVYSRDRLDSIMHAYASTIHKSQGSEYRAAVVVMPDESAHMSERALIYTAISRAREKCVLIGSPETINRAILTTRTRSRESLLKERIMGEEELESEVHSHGPGMEI